MQYSDIKKAYRSTAEYRNAKTPYAIAMREATFERWLDSLKNVSLTKARYIFTKYNIQSTRDMRKAILSELKNDKEFEANYHGFETVEEFENHTKELRARVKEKLKRMALPI